VRGLDTNILLRFLTADDPVQTQQFDSLFAAADQAGERFFISAIALCALSWTLRGRPYHLDRDQIVAGVERIFGTGIFEIQHRDLVRRALGDYRGGHADFADYLLGQECREAGCADTVTFGRKLSQAAGFSLLA
jgi:predicted nucleic-acid-binding protein